MQARLSQSNSNWFSAIATWQLRGRAMHGPFNCNLFAHTVFAICLSLVWSLGLPVKADDTKPTQEKLIQQIGIQGHWKLGQSCMVQLQVPADLRSQVQSVQVTTLDGDGVEVIYRKQFDSANGASSTIEVPVRIGRRNSVISASLLNSEGKQIATEDKALSDQEGLIETQPMILCLGSSMGVEELVRVSTGKSERSMQIIEIQQAADLPNSWLAYQPCNLVILSTANVKLLSEVQPTQWSALQTWIRRGGGCIISLGSTSSDLQAISGLQALLPGKIVGDSKISSPAALESLIISEQRLLGIQAIQLEVDSNLVKLSLRDDLAKQIPWWNRSACGFGTIQTICSDLSQPSFANWKHRKNLWERLLSPYVDKSLLESSQSEHASSTSYLGYSDITGQLRATLDQFQEVKSLGFSQVAAILLGILLLIGPIDYLISVKWLRKPHLSWPLAGVMLLISTAVLTWFYQQIRPDRLIVNSAQIIDVDTKTGHIDAHLWSHIYSAHARPLTVRMTNSAGKSMGFWDWQGLPGNGLGGLQSQLTMERGMPAYAVSIGEGELSEISGVGIPSAGTKSIYGTFSDQIEIKQQSELQELDSVDQLAGQIVNPLDSELRDVSLFYHRWFYPLKSRMPSGDVIQLSSQIIPKDLLRRLSRQTEVEGKTTSARWNPADRNSLDRLMELMMFHNAATGRNYTSLTNNYQGVIDHSNLLETDYAILLGRIESSLNQIKVTTENPTDEPEIKTGIDRTWCRILIPVTQSRKSKQAR